VPGPRRAWAGLGWAGQMAIYKKYKLSEIFLLTTYSGILSHCVRWFHSIFEIPTPYPTNHLGDLEKAERTILRRTRIIHVYTHNKD
jgi:hypothetical protein